MTDPTAPCPGVPEGHPEAEEISDLVEGLLPPDRSRALRTHLDTCPRCAEQRDALTATASLLHEAGRAPVSMPGDVAARIDAALTAAAPGDPDPSADDAPDAVRDALPAPRSDDPDGSGEAAPGRDAHRSDDVPAGSPASVSGPAAPPDGSRTEDAGRAAGPASPPCPGPSRPPRRPDASGPGRTGRRRRRWTGRALLAAAAVAVLGGGAFGVLRTTGGDGPRTTAGPAATGRPSPGAATGPAYTDAHLPQQVHRLLAGGPRHGTAAAPELKDTRGPATPDGGAGGHGPARQHGDAPDRVPAGAPGSAPGGASASLPPSPPACAVRAAGQHTAPLVADRGTYHGAPVTVLVYPAGSTRLKVIMVNAPCPGPTDAPVLTRTVPR